MNNQYKYNTTNISFDGLYLEHDDLIQLHETYPLDKLLRTRGQPETHDKALAVDFFDSLTQPSETLVPSFDKSKFDGRGRAPLEHGGVSQSIRILISSFSKAGVLGSNHFKRTISKHA
jgi:D-glycerate 3-kinase